MASANMPPAEVEVDPELVAALLSAQHPDLADLPLHVVASGWDNVMLRLGDELAVRMPRRALAAPLCRHEQRWLPLLAPRLPVAIPAPVRIGVPGLGYPWRWSVVRWIPGVDALASPVADTAALARRLGGVLAALHHPAPADAPVNPFRGVPLATRSEVTRSRIATLGDQIDAPATTAAWHAALAVPPWTAAPVWLHGDLHPANVVVDDDVLSGIVDWGDITGGDPATDLSIAWMLFDAADRAVLRDAVGNVDDATWARARGNALAHALAVLASSADNPAMAGMGARTLRAVLADTDR